MYPNVVNIDNGPFQNGNCFRNFVNTLKFQLKIEKSVFVHCIGVLHRTDLSRLIVIYEFCDFQMTTSDLESTHRPCG